MGFEYSAFRHINDMTKNTYFMMYSEFTQESLEAMTKSAQEIAKEIEQKILKEIKIDKESSGKVSKGL